MDLSVASGPHNIRCHPYPSLLMLGKALAEIAPVCQSKSCVVMSESFDNDKDASVKCLLQRLPSAVTFCSV